MQWLDYPSNRGSVLRIALYGKGGIGKSTVSANLTAALGRMGLKVLQIGCDPKHDSTRLLLEGREPPTVMEMVRSSRREDMSLDSIVSRGYLGCLCVEAGGPEPGVGCAGRGILSTFELLDELGVDSLDADITVYDVLGDVVCGGFAVPLRNDYAEKVYVVSSGEFMSIYAANNILRGVRNYDPRRMAGIIFNSRGEPEEGERVRRFAAAVGLPVVAEIPRSPRFLDAERSGRTVVESDPGADLAQIFFRLASNVVEGDVMEASPLSDEELETVVLGKSPPPPIRRGGQEEPPPEGRREAPPAYTSRNVERKEVLHGCAFTGAVITCLSVEGLQTVMHSPDSCAHLSCQMAQNAARRAFVKEGVAIPSFLRPAAHCSSLDDPDMVFGGRPSLEEALQRAFERGNDVALVSSCPSGIIGDDVEEAARAVSASRPEGRVLTMLEDGNAAGDHMQGVIDACVALASGLIDPSAEPSDGLVNVVGIKPIATNNEMNMTYAEGILRRMGAAINCRFIGGTDIAGIEGFHRARHSILANTDRFALMLSRYLREEHGAEVLRSPLAPGLRGTLDWLGELAAATDRESAAEELAASLRQEYEEALPPLRQELQGRKACIISMHKDIDWLIDTLDDLGIDLLYAAVVDRSDHLMDYHVGNRHAGRIVLLEDYDMSTVVTDAMSRGPDILLSTYPVSTDGAVLQERIPMVPDIGHLAPLELARRWALGLKAPRREGWREDHG